MVGGLILQSATNAHATATKNTENSAVGLGMADAQVGIVDDPSANYYNPAAMTRMKHSGFTLGVAPQDLEGTFEAGENLPRGAASPELRKGEKEDQILPLAPLPFAYGVYRNEDLKMAAGMGVYLPFATGSKFSENWAGREAGSESNVLALAFNPNVAFEILPGVSLAVGGSVFQSSLVVRETIITNAGNPSQDIGVHIATDGHGYQGNAALHWQPMDMVALGVSYRTAVKVDMDGDIDFKTPSSAFIPPFLDQKVKTTFRFPDTLNAGLGYFPRDDLKIDGEVEFVRYNVNRDQRFVLSTGQPSSEIVMLNEWQNTFAYRLGADWRSNHLWSFRGGLAWDPTPVPKERITPLTSDTDRVVAALGTSYHWRIHEFALGLQWQHFVKKTVGDAEIRKVPDNIRGTYRHELYVAGLSWTVAIQ
jgi:long-chain fatty acid transport protein